MAWHMKGSVPAPGSFFQHLIDWGSLMVRVAHRLAPLRHISIFYCNNAISPDLPAAGESAGSAVSGALYITYRTQIGFNCRTKKRYLSSSGWVRTISASQDVHINSVTIVMPSSLNSPQMMQVFCVIGSMSASCPNCFVPSIPISL
jgi:hypothetical protein